MKNGLDEQYIDLLNDILKNGVEKNTRNGKTISVFGKSIRYKFKDGKFPLLTTKKMPFKTIVTELLWFLKGRTDLRYLLEHGCHIWDGDAYKNYITKQPKPKVGDYENYIDCYCGHTDTCDCGPMYEKEFIEKVKTDDEFADKWGDLGPIYGRQWRDWNGKWKLTEKDARNFEKWRQNLDRKGVDQISNLINELKTNPDSRRLMVIAWNVGELDQMVLPPCHYGFQVYTRELSNDERIKLFVKTRRNPKGYEGKIENTVQELLTMNNIPTRAISLMWNQRSVDVGLGLPFNLASYGLLLMFIGKYVNMIPDELIFNGGDVHIYSNHIEPIKEQLDREPFELPKVEFIEGLFDRTFPDTEVPLDIDSLINSLKPSDFILENYKSHPTIKLPLSN